LNNKNGKALESAIKLTKEQSRWLSTDYESVRFIFNSFVFF